MKNENKNENLIPDPNEGSGLAIPAYVRFDQLQLGRHPLTHEITLHWPPMMMIFKENNLDEDDIKSLNADEVNAIVVVLYLQHRDAGGRTCIVAEELILETGARINGKFVASKVTLH